MIAFSRANTAKWRWLVVLFLARTHLPTLIFNYSPPLLTTTFNDQRQHRLPSSEHLALGVQTRIIAQSKTWPPPRELCEYLLATPKTLIVAPILTAITVLSAGSSLLVRSIPSYICETRTRVYLREAVGIRDCLHNETITFRGELRSAG